MKKYYVDTNVWRDYYEDRKDNFKPLGEFAFRFFKKCRKDNSVILYSDLTLRELNAYYSKERVEILLQAVSVFCEIKKVFINAEQGKEANSLVKRFKVHSADLLHAILARDNNAVLVSRDKHFNKLKDIVKIAKPEEII